MQKTAVETKFYQRSSKLLPFQFFDILLFIASNPEHSSLVRTTSELLDKYGITISRQAFDERFDESAVSFMKSLFESCISNQINGMVNKEFLGLFKKVRVKDGTRIELPKHLKEYFKGFGGNKASESGMCIQYEYDLKTGRLIDIDITDAVYSDSKDAKAKVSDIQKGELIIRDLGYFSLEVIKHIIKTKAYIISRLNTSTTVTEQNGQELSFEKLYKEMTSKQCNHMEKQVIIGKEQRVPVRLVIDLVSEDIYQKRIRKINAYNKRKGYATTHEYKNRCRFNLFITNIGNDQLTSEQIKDLYKTRWQIELIFKTWKSVCGMDKIKSMKYHRFMCIIYAKLLVFQMNEGIYHLINSKFFKKNNKLLSSNKCQKTLISNFEKVRTTLLGKYKDWEKLMDAITKMFSKNHWLETKKSKRGFNEIFMLFTCKSNTYDYI